MADVNGATVTRRADELSRETGVEAAGFEVDVSDWHCVERLAAFAYERFGAVHVLCNNAGVVSPSMPTWDMSLDDWRWVLGVDLWGVIHGVKAFVRRMLESGEPGHIVNTASISGLLPYAGIASYSVAKSGVVALSECLHLGLREAGARIGVSVLCPGIVATGLRRNSGSLRPGGPGGVELLDLDSMPDAQQPADIADLVLEGIVRDRFWLLSHRSYGRLIEARARGIIETDSVVAPPTHT
jgi:NAD(P)-dependent dehydrogenase (short-subunit alcohol dehydrogenase family)